MKRAKQSIDTILEVAKQNCCKKRCLQTVVTLQDILKARTEYCEKNREQQGQWLLHFFTLNQRIANGKNKLSYQINNNGEICQKAWIFCHGMSYGRFHMWKEAHFLRGLTCPVHMRTGLSIKSQKFLEAELFMGELVRSLANIMPDVNRKELPACMTIGSIFQMYKEAVSEPRLQLTQFRRMWKESFPEVIIPKRNRFTKCGLCLLINDHIRATLNKENRLSWSEKRQMHMDQQGEERKKYYKHQDKAKKNPNRYLSLIIDGMDQSKTHLPHWIQKSKLEGDCDEFLKTHVTGVLSHGHNLAWCYIDFIRWPQDANPTVNCIMSSIRHIVSTGKPLPPVLYLQLDNCYRDCKNNYILAFCALLVKSGVFRKVRLSYLIVGHTHEDIDQMFSRISVALSKSNAVTVPDLIQVMQRAYTPTPVVGVVENIYDIKSWMEEWAATFTQHSSKHAFRFTKNSSGDVIMHYRKLAKALRKEWLPKEGDPNPFVILRTVPPGNPSILRPELKKCPSVQRMRDAVSKLKVRMSSTELQWWDKFTDEEEGKVSVWESLSDEEYQSAGQTFDLHQWKYAEPQDEQESDEYRANDKLLRDLMAKKENDKPVKMKKKAKTPPGAKEPVLEPRKRKGKK